MACYGAAGVVQQGNRHLDPFPFAVVVEGGQDKARVSAEGDCHPRKGSAHCPDDPLEDGDDSRAGRGVAGAQERGDQLIGVTIEDEQGM